LPQQVSRHFQKRLGVFRRVLLNNLFKCFEVFGAGGDKSFVTKTFVDDYVGKSIQGQQVGAALDL
jgi:hypothetical protein